MMVTSKTTKRICFHGHIYLKSSSCPTCPTCEGIGKPHEGFLAQLSAPARRALMSKGIDSLNHLATYTEKQIRELHGIGPSSIPKLKNALATKGLSFKKNMLML